MSNSSIWPIDQTLSGATILGQSGPGSDSNKRVLHILQSSSITWPSSSDYLVSYQDTHWSSLTPQQRCSWCILQFQLTGLPCVCVCIYIYIYIYISPRSLVFILIIFCIIGIYNVIYSLTSPHKCHLLYFCFLFMKIDYYCV